ncbi:hypothetical protein GIB67_015883 [Kingdonia uniflora]|uniref:Protein kinase domain-containing protein n=1 Tax=Kingdonia uniflora TaxID=39325 RepID=A0A7J7NGQ7_9MAGN|nr:hypothetical protein GIB67_015883 [Kingdonia uniflora]
MHRDIKGSNLLINNDGILKMADFGLANFVSTGRQQLTSRVVTLWYRPPELLLGSTDYGAAVDLWSTGCVFSLHNSFLESLFSREELSLNNYTKSSSFVVPHPKSTGRNPNFLMQLCLNPNMLTKAVCMRPVKSYQQRPSI